jgi:glutathione synthase/RimK-type ligase-like ATP-grasp enzyme
MVMSWIGLATYSGHRTFTEDDRELAVALVERGHRVEPMPWDDASCDWSKPDGVVIRSTWNYWERPDAFEAWFCLLERSGTRVVNSLDVMRWNLSKTYLAELADRGVPIVPTYFCADGDDVGGGELMACFERFDCDELVIKPVVSAAAFETHRVRQRGAVEFEKRFGEIVRARAMMVQPFMEEIVSHGEWSLMYVDGTFSHAVLKTACDGDYRVQEEYGGTPVGKTPPDEVLRSGERVMATLTDGVVYARVDLVESGGRSLLMELELIEPALYLRYGEGSAKRLARAIENALVGSKTVDSADG